MYEVALFLHTTVHVNTKISCIEQHSLALLTARTLRQRDCFNPLIAHSDWSEGNLTT